MKLEKGDIIYTILRHTARSGMTRWIDAFVVKEGMPIKLIVILNDNQRKRFRYEESKRGFKCVGFGMDMGFHLVYNLGVLFYDDGYAFKQEWI